MLDLVSREILKNGLINITREMGAIMARTSYSSILNEGKDYSCAIFDAHGDLSAEAEFVLVHLAAMHFSVKNCVREIGASDFDPGDIVVHNDPYLGGSHLPDVTMIRPVHHAGELVAFVANRAHYPDIGGLAPGSFAGEAEEILHEGVRIPPIKLYKKDVLDEQLLRLWAANVRAPKSVYADSAAQVASIRIGELRLFDLIEREGIANVQAGISHLMDYCEELLRSRIRQVPNGEYTYFDYMDDSGQDTEPVRIMCTMTVGDDDLTFDFSGTDPQVKCPINMPHAVTCSATYGAVKCVLVPDAPLNAGMYRAMDVIAPKHSLANASYPAPVAAGQTNGSQRVVGIIMGCLAQAVPDLVEACEYGANSDLGLGGVNPRNGDPYALYMMPPGGMGALPTKDGNSATNCTMGNVMNQPAEVWEAMYPFRVNFVRLRTNSAGAGKHRGGFGEEVQYESLDDDALLSIFTERVKVPPFGLFEGLPGLGGRYVLETHEGSMQLSTKRSRLGFHCGATFTSSTCGGGGYGHPFERESLLVYRDFQADLITREYAKECYGVHIDNQDKLNETLTQDLRNRRNVRQEVTICGLVQGNDPRSISISTELASKFSVAQGDLMEITGGTIPLRAWAKISDELVDDQIMLPELICRILAIDVGEKVKVRQGTIMPHDTHMN